MSFLLWGVKWVFPLNLEEEAHGFNKWQLGLGMPVNISAGVRQLSAA